MRKITVLFLIFLGSIAFAQNPPTAVPSLKYTLIEKFGEPFYCDRDLWPVARQEEPRAQEWFSKLDYSDAEFKMMSSRMKLEKPADHMTEAEILSLYREHKKLLSIPIEGSTSPFTFMFRTGKFGEQGESITGTITAAGEIVITQKETVENMCPKCLAEGTRIDTPMGEVAVENLRAGMPIWTLDANGKRVASEVADVARIAVPPGHEVLKMSLENGRTLFVSPEHPLADGRAAQQLRAGDVLYGISVLSVQQIPYSGKFTYDVRPSGSTGAYWAEGLLLGTTINR